MAITNPLFKITEPEPEAGPEEAKVKRNTRYLFI
jgi:hypothetical protein